MPNKLEKMTLSIGGFACGYKSITISVKRETVYVSYNQAFWDEPQKPIRLSVNKSKQIISRIEALHIECWKRSYHPDCLICDGEQWELEYCVSEKKPKKVSGDNAYPPNWTEFLDVIDYAAPSAGLIDSERIESISLTYQRHTTISTQSDSLIIPNKVIWDYSETLSIYRKEETLIYIKHIGTGCRATHSYYVQDGIDEILDEFQSFFAQNSIAEVLPETSETPTISISILRRNGTKEEMYAPYNRHSMPQEWEELIETIADFVSFYGLLGEIFDSNTYKRGVKSDEFIYCSCEFDSAGKTYYYRTEDDSISVGDRVVVPVGNDGKERIVEVVSIEYFPKNQLPLPLEKTKVIIRKIDNIEKQSVCHCPLCEEDISVGLCMEVSDHFDEQPSTKSLPPWVDDAKQDVQKEICSKCKYHRG